MDASSEPSIFVSLPYGLCLVDAEGRILDLNPAIERLFGWRREERRGQRLSGILEQVIADPAQALTWTVAISQALAGGQTTYLNLPAAFRTGVGDEPVVSITGVVAPCPGDGPERALVLFQPGAPQRGLEGEWTRFLAVVAHELSTPVNNLSAAADLLARRLEADDSPAGRLVQVIRTEANHLRWLFAQFPATLPVVDRARPPRKQLAPARPLLRQVAQAFQVRRPDCPIVIRAPSGCFVWSDPEMVKAVLGKLLDNAIRYAPPGSQIVLAAKGQGDEVVISVRDHGPGIAEEDGEQVFEPWSRGRHEGPSAEHQGLGLAIARTLVQTLGGRLWYEPCPEGGVRFCLSLPRAQGWEEEGGEEEPYGTDDPDRGG